jgi:hypothetical protein
MHHDRDWKRARITEPAADAANLDGRTKARKQFDAIAEGIAQDLGGRIDSAQ